MPGHPAALQVTTIAVPPRPYGVAVDSRRNIVYATAFETNELIVIDGASQTVKRAIAVGFRPHSVAVDEATGRVYVSNVDGQTVSIIDGASISVSATVNVAGNPVGIDVDALRSRAITVHGGTSMTVITTTDSGTVTSSTLSTGAGANGYVAVNALTNRAYVTKNSPSPGSSQIARLGVIDLSNNTIITDVASPGFFEDLMVNPATNRVYVANNNTSSVAVFDSTTNQLLTNIAVPGNPTDIAVNTGKNCVYSANATGNSVTIINGATNTILSNVAVGSAPKAIAVNQQTGLVYVANRVSSSVSVIRDVVCANPPVPTTVVPSPTRPVTYTLRLPVLQNGDEIEQPSNDTIASAQPINSRRRIAAKLDDLYDVYVFDAKAGPVRVRLLDMPTNLSGRVQLSVYFSSDFAAPANQKIFDINAPWEGEFTAAAGKYYVTVFTDPAYQALRTPYAIEAVYE